MKSYVAVLLQMMVWSGYSLAEWLSSRDHWEYNVAMFVIFVFLAFRLAKYIVKSTKASFFITVGTLSIYYLIHWGLPSFTTGI
ncbi:hypothetical protein GCM10008967_14630 [Bacillus carboniphilus]|uniref:Uncharacterized protein n=2 Tax=Bacillus carboniphilus TaxID=86663 RepID=A0ABN0W4R0_9BACI